MAKVLETGLKFREEGGKSEFYKAGTPLAKLSKGAKAAARKADILINQPLAPKEDEPEAEETSEE